MNVEINQQVLDGLGYLFDVFDTNDCADYLDEEMRANVEAAGKWYGQVNQAMKGKIDA